MLQDLEVTRHLLPSTPYAGNLMDIICNKLVGPGLLAMENLLAPASISIDTNSYEKLVS